MGNPIDIILPWVDGSDPAWLAEKSATVPSTEGDQRVNRYRDWGILQYWFRGVAKFAPWIRTVHFITWGHLPPWLNTKHPKLHIVNHRDFIPEQYLPTFNCNPFEVNLHRIEGLADQFVYSNDDVFFIRPLEPEFFFRDGLPVDAALENVLQFYRPDGIDRIVANDLECLNMNFDKKEVVAAHRDKWYSRTYGKSVLKNFYLKPFSHFTGFVDPHMPNAYLKETFEQVWKACPDRLEKTCTHRVRSNEDVNQWLFRYWQFATGNFTPGNPNRGEFYVIGKDDEAIRAALLSQSTPIVCLSDDYPEIDFEREQAFLIDALNQILPDPCSFEI